MLPDNFLRVVWFEFSKQQGARGGIQIVDNYVHVSFLLLFDVCVHSSRTFEIEK